jgi:glutathione S-transferase
MLKLYKYGNSICTQKVFILLDAKKIDYEPINVDLFKNEQYNPAYLKLNPKGVVPTLVHDDDVIVESTLICEYIDEVYPKPSFTPGSPSQKSRMRLWSKMVDEALHAASRELSFSAIFREKLKKMTAEQRETRFKNVGDPDRRARNVSCFEYGVESPYVLQGIAAYEKAFKTMEADLASEGPWLLGRDISLADINMMPFVARLAYLNLLDVWLEGRPHVADWWRRVEEYPSFKSQIRMHVTDVEMTEMQTSGAKIKQQVAAKRREYLQDFNVIAE